MDRDDHPAVGRRARGMEHLALRQAAVAGMHRCDRRLVLLLGAISEPMYDAISHLAAPLHLEATRRAARSATLQTSKQLDCRIRLHGAATVAMPRRYSLCLQAAVGVPPLARSRQTARL